MTPETEETLLAQGYSKEQAFRILESARLRKEIENLLEIQLKQLRSHFWEMGAEMLKYPRFLWFWVGGLCGIFWYDLLKWAIEK